MASYKVIQNVEAEDKILGPLTLRQFIYAGMAAIFLYLTYFVATHNAGFMAAVFLPFAAVLSFFAFPWGRDQPTEVWALAKIRFLMKPRRRIWDQSGVKELVTVTAPKAENIDYTNGLSQTEVRSRLRALADTIDSRGWALKNASVSMYGQPSLLGQAGSDRLLNASTLPQPMISSDVQPSDDMLDEKSNPVARNMENMIEASAKAHREKIMENLRQEAPAPTPAQPPANNYWFLNQPAQPTNIPSNMVTFNTQVVEPGMDESELPTGIPGQPTEDEQKLVQELEAHKKEMPMTAYYGHLHTVQPLSAQHRTAPVAPPQQAAPTMPGMPPQTAMPVTPGAPYGAPMAAPTTPVAAPPQAPAAPAPPPVTPAQQAAILQLANNDDLNVATLAREAKRSGEQDEVVIKLH